MESTYTVIPPIDQRTIECDLRAFTRWLNNLVDQVNYLTKIYTELKEQVDINKEDIRLLKNRATTIENRLDNHETRITNLEEAVAGLDLETINQLIAMVNGRVDMLYGWLPIPYGMIDPKGWKFAMGNINAMSTQDAPSNVDGPGIYTSGSVEDNDINFK